MTKSNCSFELLNGEFVSSDSLLFDSSNRAFRYGDGLFETMKVVNGVPLFLKDHVDRLVRGCAILGLNAGPVFDYEKLKGIVTQLLDKNNVLNARVRLTVFRDGDGLYFTTSDRCFWHISCLESEQGYYETNKFGINLGVFNEEVKTTGKLSNVKTLNSLVYIVAATYAQKHSFDDVLISNTRGNFIETVSSNLFVFKDGNLNTPPLSDGCLEGVLRKNVIRISETNGLKCIETSVDTDMLNNADEILLTNVIKGVQWVKNFNGNSYSGQISEKLNKLLTEMCK